MAGSRARALVLGRGRRGPALRLAAVLVVIAGACAAPRRNPSEVAAPATSVVPPELLPGATPPPVPTPRVFGPIASPGASPAASPVASPAAATPTVRPTLLPAGPSPTP